MSTLDCEGLDIHNAEEFSVGAVNFLVGPNSSSKSRFMRRLACGDDLRVGLRGVDDLATAYQEAAEEAVSALRTYNVVQIGGKEVEQSLPRSIQPQETWSLAKGPDLEEIGSAAQFALQSKGATKVQTSDRRSGNPNALFRQTWKRSVIPKLHSAGVKLGELQNRFRQTACPFDRCYIPTLRGLRVLEPGRDHYQTITEQNYFQGTKQRPKIFTGQALYQTLIHDLLGSRTVRRRVSEFEDFLAQLLQLKRVSLQPRLAENRGEDGAVIWLDQGDGSPERPLHLLGDGVQAVITLTYLAFTAENPTIFFVEEPELHLHPGLMRQLVDSWFSLDRHLFFCTTHSNHLLDLSVDRHDVTVTQFKPSVRVAKSEENQETHEVFDVRQVDRADQSSLQLLGARCSSVFLVNATVWVEGITDRMYVRAFLRLLEQNLGGSPLREDHHYAFVEYGGANLVHWSFLRKEESPIAVETLCAEAFLLVDQDSSSSKNERNNELAERLGEQFGVTCGREIENTLPPEVIAAVVRHRESKKGGGAKLPELRVEDYRDRKLGEYLKEVAEEFHGRAKYVGPNGTLHDKLGFCRVACGTLAEMRFLDLPEETQKLTERIYSHIARNNGHTVHFDHE